MAVAMVIGLMCLGRSADASLKEIVRVTCEANQFLSRHRVAVPIGSGADAIATLLLLRCAVHKGELHLPESSVSEHPNRRLFIRGIQGRERTLSTLLCAQEVP